MVRGYMECESLLSLFPAKLASPEMPGAALLPAFDQCASKCVEASFEGKSESKLSHSKKLCVSRWPWRFESKSQNLKSKITNGD
jgi:hypothetical protein